MTDVFVVYDDLKQIEKLKDTSRYSLEFHFIDSETKKGKKEAWKIKSHYAAKLNPFAVILDNNKPIKAFYTEAEDVVDSLINYLDGQ